MPRDTGYDMFSVFKGSEVLAVWWLALPRDYRAYWLEEGD